MGSGGDIVESAKERVVSVAGGPARLQIIAVLAAILAVESSDLGTVSAVSGELKGAFHLGNTEAGLLLAVVSFVGAAATLPMGTLVDRFSRRVLLMFVVASWVIAEGISGFATSFSFLLVTRAIIGALTAVAWPCVAPIDAARLDIVHPRMWGRGEAGRMALCSTFEGGAPLLFGAMSEWLGGGQNGLMWTFLIMLIPMLVASMLGVTARKTYLRDVATAAATSRAYKS